MPEPAGGGPKFDAHVAAAEVAEAFNRDRLRTRALAARNRHRRQAPERGCVRGGHVAADEIRESIGFTAAGRPNRCRRTATASRDYRGIDGPGAAGRPTDLRRRRVAIEQREHVGRDVDLILEDDRLVDLAQHVLAAIRIDRARR